VRADNGNLDFVATVEALERVSLVFAIATRIASGIVGK
jgi:hypothetical protein